MKMMDGQFFLGIVNKLFWDDENGLYRITNFVVVTIHKRGNAGDSRDPNPFLDYNFRCPSIEVI